MRENKKEKKSIMADTIIQTTDIAQLLPGFNCRDCGFAGCTDFAEALVDKKTALTGCRFMQQQRFNKAEVEIVSLLSREYKIEKKEKISGVIDGCIADFILHPLKGECSCREILFPFYQKEYKAGDLIRYRPLGCPLPHFARIIQADKGLITVHIVGPCCGSENTDSSAFEDIGVCMVGGFIGIIEGKRPKVSQTVRFLPDGCMMQKVHSGVIVQMEGDRAIIEGIDLKVWALPEIIS